jgi:spore coat protein U-like protein
MRIKYNTSAFGSSVVANGNIQITRATPFNTISYNDPQVDVIDQTSNTIGLPFGSNYSATTWARQQSTSTPIVMLRQDF